MPARAMGRAAGTVRPPRRHRGRRLLPAAVAVVALLAGVLAFADQLRHPLTGDGEVAAPQVIGDPRDEPPCPDVEGPPGGADAAAPDPPHEVTARDLRRCPGSYHGRRVRYVGEAVGELLERGDHAWVQLNDDPYRGGAPLPHRADYAGANAGVGARLPAGAADAIGRVGGSRAHGDVVAVEGTFYRALPDTADAVAIDVERIERVGAGGALPERVRPARRVAALALGVLAAAMVAAERFVAGRR